MSSVLADALLGVLTVSFIGLAILTAENGRCPFPIGIIGLALLLFTLGVVLGP